MKKNNLVVVLAILLACVGLCALDRPDVPDASTNCEDNFSWMENSSSSPNNTACQTWSSDTDTIYDWTTVWNSENRTGKFYLQNPPVRSHNVLQVGSSSGHSFEVSEMSMAFFQMSWALQPRYDGFIIQVSFNGGDSWSEVTSVGGVLSPGYNYTMSTSTSLDAPPTGLRGIPAYSGSMATTWVTLDLRQCTTTGPAILRIYFVSSSSVAVEGIHLYRFEYWDADVNPPSVSGWADNSSVYINWSPGEYDPRLDHTEVWHNGVIVPNATSPLQITGLVNGTEHVVEVKNVPLYGNTMTTPCSPSPLTPVCTEKPPVTLLMMNTGGGSWVEQTAEVPCGSGIGPVDGYLVYRSLTPDGPWNLVATVPSAGTQFYDPPAPLPGEVIHYLVWSEKNGVSEQDIPGK